MRVFKGSEAWKRIAEYGEAVANIEAFTVDKGKTRF